MSNIIDQLPKVKGVYRQNSRIKNWFDLDAKAEVIFRPADLDDLAFFLKNRPSDIPINIIGAGSNVILKDPLLKGVLINLGGNFAKVTRSNDVIEVGAACLCKNLALATIDFELSGLEFLTGVPGAVGGAIAMNAGCYGSDISNILISANAIDYDGRIIELTNSDFNFFYRGSELVKSTKLIFVSAKFTGKKSSQDEVTQQIKEHNDQREEAQPIRSKTGGSTFKNPTKEQFKDAEVKKAWQLIDESGFRGFNIGDAQISDKHCNFLINKGQASSQDLISVIKEVQEGVLKKTGIALETEIKII